MAYFGGSATQRPASTFDLKTILFVLVSLLLLGSIAFLMLNPEMMKLPVQERIVIREVPVAPASQEVFVAGDTIWPGQKVTPLMFKKVLRPVQGMETKVITNSSDLDGVFAKTVIPSDTPVLREYITTVPPVNALTARIPAGFRAVTIAVDTESGVEGWARPGVKVDVIWITTQRGRQVVTTLLENVQIVSAERSVVAAEEVRPGIPQPAAPSHVTLLVATKDAGKIQLAKNSGTLSLVLRGDTDTESAGTTTVTIDRILKGRELENPDENQGSVVIDGKKYVVRGREILPLGRFEGR